jgi:hypothetical protein
MPFSAYDSKGLHLLSESLSESLAELGRLTGPVSETQTILLHKTLSDRLMKAYDKGEREPAALKTAALMGFVPVEKLEKLRTNKTNKGSAERIIE